MSVRITGPVLSALLFEHSNADNDLEGLLLGSVTDVVKDTISDSSLSNVQRQTVYNIFSFVPCSLASRWYDKKMAVRDERIERLMNGHERKELIGWFRLRRNSSMIVSMKERSICRHLLKWLHRNENGGKRDLLFMLCVSHRSHQTALFTCDHQFMVYDNRATLMCIPETVTNLAETARASYRLPVGQVTSTMCSYNRVLSKCKSTFLDDKDESAVVGEIRQLNKKLHSKLRSLSGSVEDSEQQLAQELAEVIALRQKVAASQDGVDATMDALQLSDLSSGNPGFKSNDVPYLNVKDNPDDGVELMLTEDAAEDDKQECNLAWTSDSSNDTVLLLDANERELAGQVLCLQPTPVVPPAACQTATPTKTNRGECSNTSSDTVDSQSSLGIADPIAAASEVERPAIPANIIANGGETKQPVSGVKSEPFGFVSDVMMSYASPVKQSHPSSLMNDRRNLNTAASSSHSTMTSWGHPINETGTVVDTCTVAAAAAGDSDSDESL